MRPRALVALSAGVLAAGSLACIPAHAAAPRRIIVVLCEEPLEVWERTPQLRPLLREAALGLLEQVPPERARAIDVLGAGARDGEDSSTLARALSLEGVPFVARAEAGRALGAGNIRVDIADAVPGDFATPSLAVLQGAALIPAARALLQRDDVLLVLAMPPGSRTGVVAALGPGYAGILSAHARGVVTLEDVAPSILSILQIEPPDLMTGRAFRAVPATDPVRALRKASRSRSPVPALLLLALGAVGLLVARRRRRGAAGA